MDTMIVQYGLFSQPSRWYGGILPLISENLVAAAKTVLISQQVKSVHALVSIALPSSPACISGNRVCLHTGHFHLKPQPGPILYSVPRLSSHHRYLLFHAYPISMFGSTPPSSPSSSSSSSSSCLTPLSSFSPQIGGKPVLSHFPSEDGRCWHL
jgi:hypothetical protein